MVLYSLYNKLKMFYISLINKTKKHKQNILYFVFFTCIFLIMQLNLNASERNKFPTRRIGGGTRGGCGSSELIHIVPEESYYLPDSTSKVAIYLGPLDNATELNLIFKEIPEKKLIQKKSQEIKSNLIVKGQSILIFTLPKIKSPIYWQSNFNCQSKNHQDEFNYVFSSSVPAATIIKKDNINNNDIIYRRKINNLYEHCGEVLSKEEHSISIPDSLFPYIKNTFIIKCL